MRKPTYSRHATSVAASALVLAAVSTVYGQQKPYTGPGTGQPPGPPPKPAAPPATAPAAPAAPAEPATGLEKFFNTDIPDVFAKGKFNLNARLRYEFVDQDNLAEDSNAPTIRTRFGFTTAPLYGFQGMIEGENVTAIGSDNNYNAAGSNGQGSRPVVADPETTELNQAWLGYSYTNLVSSKVGRQRIALDNHRFVGDVGWRQNMQTFDAATVTGKPVQDLSLFYGYVWDVRRVFGDVDGLPAANTDFDSNSHLINAAYSGWKYGAFTGYAYLLDLENNAGAANSAATYGGFFAGAAPLSDTVNLSYRAEYAWQTDYADSPLDYETEYYNLEVGAFVKPVSFGAGYELLGSDNNQGFRTPLATGHAFNGWADVFLVTPALGLRDLYGFAQVTLPGKLPLRFVYHKYDSDAGDSDYGQEFDVQLSRSFGKNWNALLKYSYYAGEDAPYAYDAQKFWAQVEFNF